MVWWLTIDSLSRSVLGGRMDPPVQLRYTEQTFDVFESFRNGWCGPSSAAIIDNKFAPFATTHAHMCATKRWARQLAAWIETGRYNDVIQEFDHSSKRAAAIDPSQLRRGAHWDHLTWYIFALATNRKLNLWTLRDGDTVEVLDLCFASPLLSKRNSFFVLQRVLVIFDM